MNTKTIGCFFAVSMFFSGVAHSRLGALNGIGEMLDSADVVVKGEVLKIGESSPATFSSRDTQKDAAKRYLKAVKSEVSTAHIKIDKVLKGDIDGGTIDVNFYTAKSQSFVKLARGEYVLLFLKREQDKLYLLSYDSGKIPAKRSSPGATKRPISSPRDAVIDEFIEMAIAQDTGTALSGLDGLAQINSKDAMPVFKDFLRDNRLPFRVKAIAGLIRLGDYEVENEFMKELLSDKLNSSNVHTQEVQEARRDLVHAIMHMGDTKNAKYSKALVQLVNHKDRFIRQASINALRQIKSSDAIPTFVSLLDDPNPNFQYVAVISLCEMNNPKKTGCPSSIRFDQDRQKYITEWKNWWSTHKATQK